MLVSHIITHTHTCGSGIRERSPGDQVLNKKIIESLWKIRENNLNYKYVTQFSRASLKFSHTFPNFLYESEIISLGVCVCLFTQLCSILCDPIDCSPPGSSVHRIFQARILEWVATSSSRGSSPSRDQKPCLLQPQHWQAESLLLARPGKPALGDVKAHRYLLLTALPRNYHPELCFKYTRSSHKACMFTHT